MEAPWCKNIVIVQDSLAFWPSDGFLALFIFGLSGLVICYRWWRHWEADYSLWVGVLIIIASIFYFQEINIERQKAVQVYQSDSRIDLIGEVSERQISFLGYGVQYDVDAPWGIMNNPLYSRDKIWFKVGSQRVSSDVHRFSFKPGNKCNWWRCDLEHGDTVLVSVDTGRFGKQLYNSNVETFYWDTLRIERCDDNSSD